MASCHGRINTMKSAIDRSGRVIIPKPLRDRLGLVGGEQLEILEIDGVIEIRAAHIETEVVETVDGPVIVATQPVRPVTDDDVRRTLERLRQ